MIRQRLYALIDALVDKVLERSKYRNPEYIRVNGRFIHVDDYARLMGAMEGELP